jgi:hypothetical protein
MSPYRWQMVMLQAFQMDGGPHHGASLDPTVRGPHPETLFVISFDDGAAYARAGERARDGEGQLREVFRFDPDGSLTERAKRRFTSLA